MDPSSDETGPVERMCERERGHARGSRRTRFAFKPWRKVGALWSHLRVKGPDPGPTPFQPGTTSSGGAVYAE